MTDDGLSKGVVTEGVTGVGTRTGKTVGNIGGRMRGLEGMGGVVEIVVVG